MNKLNILLTVFGRKTQVVKGVKKDVVDTNNTVTVDLITGIDRDTGHYETVQQRIARFLLDAEYPTYKIANISPALE